MKKIVISQRIDKIDDRNETRDALDQRLTKFVLEGGHLPIPVPNSFSPNCASFDSNVNLKNWLLKIRPEGVIISGGNDIGDEKERDAVEFMLLDYAKQNHLPTLGLCRGMLLLSHWHGVRHERVKGHVRTRHYVDGQIGREVNSYHNFSIKNCPLEFTIIGKSNDGQIEAMRHNYIPWEGWMWHPEREKIFDENDLNRFRALFA